MSKPEHVHKFRRHTYKSGSSTYFCALPDCNKKISPALALGKRTICWRCGEEFLMNEYSIRLAKPHCLNCHQPKEKRSSERVVEMPAVETVKQMLGQAIKPKDAISEMRNRLSNPIHGNLAGKPDEEDI